MRPLLILCFSLLSLSAFSQSDSLRLRQEAKDSVNRMLQRELHVSKDSVDEVLSAIDVSIAQMTTIARDRTLPGEEKLKRFKEIAADRDKKIKKYLSPEKEQKLQAIMTSNKEKQQLKMKDKGIKKE